MKKKKKTSLCTKITIFCLVVTVISVALWALLYKVNTMIGVHSIASNGTIEEEDYSTEPKKENISALFAGVDKDGLRTDSIIYAKYDTVNNKLYMMSIPRDTYTTNPLATYKINSIYYGGKHTQEFVWEIEDLLDVEIDYYAIINLDTIYTVVEEIGGLTITLDDEIWKLNKKTGEWYFVFPKGEQTLNAKQVETLVRNRDYADGDLSRGKMQRKVMTALIQNMMSAKNILKLPQIANIILENINTNVTVREAMKYISEIKEINLSEITSVNMPIENISYTVNGTSCVLVDEEEARRIIAEEWIYTAPSEEENTSSQNEEN